MRRRVTAAKLIDLDSSHVDQCLERVTSKSNGRCIVVLEHYRDALDLESVCESEINQLDIECEPLDCLKAEQLVGNVTPEPLQAALGVEETAGYECRRNFREGSRCEPPSN